MTLISPIYGMGIGKKNSKSMKKKKASISQSIVTKLAGSIGLHGNAGFFEIANKLRWKEGLEPFRKGTPRHRIKEYLARVAGGELSNVVHVKAWDKNDQGSETNRVSSNVDVTKDDFLSTYAWRQLRMKVLKKYGRRCACCGATPETGSKMNVDHIKPRKKYPELALDESNLQVLCEECNHGKGNWDETDWRTA